MKRTILLLTLVIFAAALTLFTGNLFTNKQKIAAAQATTACPSIPASPNYLATSSPQDAVAALNNAHAQEDLPALKLPAHFYQLNPAQQQFIILNQERTDRHLSPLTLDASLSLVATSYSKQMRDLNFFAHSSPISGTYAQRVQANPVVANHYALAAENLAGNPVAGAGAMYEYLYNDAAENCGHRINILNPQLTLVGIGWTSGSMYGSISAQEFITSSHWSPYTGQMLNQDAPRITVNNVHVVEPKAAKHQVSVPYMQASAQIQDKVGGTRITWFVDRFGNQPQTGTSCQLNLKSLSHGQHTLLAYVTNGAQNYGVARYTFTV